MDSVTIQEQPSVLIVEDNDKLATLYRIWLEDSCRIHIANDCETAYGFFQDEINVVLLDRELPDGLGDEILERIREMELGWSVAIISGIEPSLRDLEMPFDEYIQKPIDKDVLTETVERMYLRAEIGDRLDEFYSLSTKKRMLERYYPGHNQLPENQSIDIEGRLEELYSMLKYSNSVALDPCSSQP